MQLLADATLPDLMAAFPPPFQLSLYRDETELKNLLKTHKILLCRATLQVDESLLQDCKLDYVLTASSGRNHLDEPYLESKGIGILDAKGANASAVADYVLSCLAYLEVYHAFHPQTAGIIGLGAVGSEVLTRLRTLNLSVFTYDPLKALQDPSFNNTPLNTLADCDLVCIHANLHRTAPYASYHLINADFLKQRSPNTAIINASRGDLVDEQALVEHHQGLYCTDVFSNEPTPSRQILQHATVCTPHIAGHTLEAKHDIIRLLSHKLHECYQLPKPIFEPHPRLYQSTPHLTWQRTILTHYNPEVESQQLKASTSPQDTFLALRAKHMRHGFEA